MSKPYRYDPTELESLNVYWGLFELILQYQTLLSHSDTGIKFREID